MINQHHQTQFFHCSSYNTTIYRAFSFIFLERDEQPLKSAGNYFNHIQFSSHFNSGHLFMSGARKEYELCDYETDQRV